MTVTRDNLKRWCTPADASEWTELLADITVDNPISAWMFTEAASPVLDLIGSLDISEADGDASPDYEAFLPGWSRTAIKFTAGSAMRLIGTLPGNVNANSYTLMLIARPTTQGTDRTLMRLGTTFDDDAVLEINGSSFLKVGEGDGTRSTGSADVVNADSFYTLRVDDTGNQVDGFFNKDILTGGTQACNGTEICFGGNNVQTYFSVGAWFIYAALWDSALGDLDIEDVIARMKNGPAALSGSGYSRSRVVNS